MKAKLNSPTNMHGPKIDMQCSSYQVVTGKIYCLLEPHTKAWIRNIQQFWIVKGFIIGLNYEKIYVSCTRYHASLVLV